MVNMMATFLTFGCIAGSGVAVFSLMGNGKKIEGYFLCGVWCGVGGLCSVVSCGVLWCAVFACRVQSLVLFLWFADSRAERMRHAAEL